MLRWSLSAVSRCCCARALCCPRHQRRQRLPSAAPGRMGFNPPDNRQCREENAIARGQATAGTRARRRLTRLAEQHAAHSLLRRPHGRRAAAAASVLASASRRNGRRHTPLERGVFVRQMRPLGLSDFSPFAAPQLQRERVKQERVTLVPGSMQAEQRQQQRRRRRKTCIGAGRADTSPSVFSTPSVPLR